MTRLELFHAGHGIHSSPCWGRLFVLLFFRLLCEVLFWLLFVMDLLCSEFPRDSPCFFKKPWNQSSSLIVSSPSLPTLDVPSLAGHAYTILRFLDVEVTRNGKKETLLLMHVRNPHATNELRRARNATLSPKTMCTSWEGSTSKAREDGWLRFCRIGLFPNGAEG